MSMPAGTPETNQVEVSGHLDRRAMEALYIEMRAAAQARGLELELVRVERRAPEPKAPAAQSSGAAISSSASAARA